MQAHNHAVDEHSVRNALRIRDWFNLQQDALRTPQRAAADEDAWHTARDMMRERPVVGITLRDLYDGRRVCRDSETAKRLATQWETEGRIQSFKRKPDGAGRPTIAYTLTTLGRR